MSYAPRACKYPFCPALVVDGYYCPTHKPTPPPQVDARELSSAQRGYDATWRKFRKWFILRHPLCHDCLYEATNEVHHIFKLVDYPHLRLVESACMGLCKPCHQRRTANGE